MIKNVTDRVPLRFFKSRFRIYIGRKCFIFLKSHKKHALRRVMRASMSTTFWLIFDPLIGILIEAKLVQKSSIKNLTRLKFLDFGPKLTIFQVLQ